MYGGIFRWGFFWTASVDRYVVVSVYKCWKDYSSGDLAYMKQLWKKSNERTLSKISRQKVSKLSNETRPKIYTYIYIYTKNIKNIIKNLLMVINVKRLKLKLLIHIRHIFNSVLRKIKEKIKKTGTGFLYWMNHQGLKWR